MAVATMPEGKTKIEEPELAEGTHGVVVVHGIGDQRKGDTVAEFSKALCDTLVNPANGGKRPTVELASDVTGSPPSVTLRITAPDGKKARWICTEAFWNDAFPQPSATQVLGFGLRQNLGRQLASLGRMFRDPGNENLPTD